MRHLWIGVVLCGVVAFGCGTSGTRGPSRETGDLPDASPDVGPGDLLPDEAVMPRDGIDGADVQDPDEGSDGGNGDPSPGDDEVGAGDTAPDGALDPDPETPGDAPPDPSEEDARETVSPDPAPATAGTVVDAPGNTGSGFQDASRAANGVRGGGQNAGGMDVFSLGYQEGVDNYLVLSWGGATVHNGPGADFVVFENGFEVGAGSGSFFLDQIVVMLSRDGVTFVPFPHDYVAEDETKYQSKPEAWQGFGGRYPVKYNVDSNPVDPFDHEAAGGDPFDLDGMPLDGGEGQAIREKGFRYLKLVAAPTVLNPDTGAAFVRDPASNGADIDGVVARYVQE